MKCSIVNKQLNRIRRTFQAFNRIECSDARIVNPTHTLGIFLPQDDEGSVERQAEMGFALQELRDLVLAMPLYTPPKVDTETAPLLVELSEICSNGNAAGPLLIDLR